MEGTQTDRPGATEKAHFRGFDGLRAMAAVSVFLFHDSIHDLRPLRHHYGRYLTLLDIGVPLFFVISGFLLYRPFVTARFAGRPRPSAREFLRRRVLRVIPGFWVAFTVLCLAFNVNASKDRSWKWAIVNYGLLQSFVETAARPGLGLAWTIGTEMTFYIALPVYALVLARRALPPEAQLRRELVAIAMLVAVSVAFRVFFLNWSFSGSLAWYNGQIKQYLPPNADYFAGGMLLAVLSVWFARVGAPRWASSRLLAPTAWGTAIAAYVFYIEVIATSSLGGHETRWELFLTHELFFLCVIALALPAVFGEPGRGLIRRTIESRPLQLVGLISFGIYLYHQSMITFVYRLAGAKHVFGGTKFPNGPDFPYPVMALMVAAATAACATASYMLVEARFLRRKHRPAKAPGWVSEPAATTQPSEPR